MLGMVQADRADRAEVYPGNQIDGVDGAIDRFDEGVNDGIERALDEAVQAVDEVADSRID